MELMVLFLVLVILAIFISPSLPLYKAKQLIPNRKSSRKLSKMREQWLTDPDTDHTYHAISVDGKAEFWTVGEARESLKALSIVLRREGITIYDETTWRRPLLIAPYHTLRGVFYSEAEYANAGQFGMEMHFLENGVWQILVFPFETVRAADFNSFLYRLEDCIDDERYGIFRGRMFVKSQTANVSYVTQRLTGTWQLTRRFTLYLMPLYLVFIDLNGKTLDMIHTDNIRDVMQVYDREIRQYIVSISSYDDTQHTIAVKDSNLASEIARAAADIQSGSVDDILIPTRKRKEHPYQKKQTISLKK